MRPRRGAAITLGHFRRGRPLESEGDMSKNDSPCKRACEIAQFVHALWRQPGNEDQFQEQFTAFIPEAAEYRKKLRQQNQTETGPLWAEAAPSLASKFTRLASLHDQCLQETEKILDAVPGATGDEDQAWWASECAYAWIRPALKGDTKRLGALEAYLTDVRAALDANDTGRVRVQAHSPLWFEFAKRHGLTREEYQSILDGNEKAWRKAKRLSSLPFPLPDIYDADDPRLPGDALAAVREYRLLVRPLGPDPEHDEDQLRKARDVAQDIRLGWFSNDVELAEVPIPNNPAHPADEDFFRLEQWFLTAAREIRRKVAREGEVAKGAPAARDTEGDNGMSEQARAQEIAHEVGTLLVPHENVVRKCRSEFERILAEWTSRIEKQREAFRKAVEAVCAEREAVIQGKKEPLLTRPSDKPPRKGYRWHPSFVDEVQACPVGPGLKQGGSIGAWVPAEVYETRERGESGERPWQKRERPFAVRVMRLALLHDEALPEASRLLGPPEDDSPLFAIFREEFRVHMSGAFDLEQVFGVEQCDDQLPTWSDDALDGLLDDLNRVEAALGEHAGQAGGDNEPIKTPDNDPNLVYQCDAAEFYNIPKSTLSNAAKKAPGTPGYLWSDKRGRRRFYRKKDMERLSRSRAKLRGPSGP